MMYLIFRDRCSCMVWRIPGGFVLRACNAHRRAA